MKVKYKTSVTVSDGTGNNFWLTQHTSDNELEAINQAELWSNEYNVRVEKITTETVYIKEIAKEMKV